MWELIRANERKSIYIFIGLGIVLVTLGYAIGAALYYPDGGWMGMAAAFFIWIVLALVSYFQGDAIFLAITGAKEITYDVNPQLFNIVEEMTIASSLPARPKIYVIDDPTLNAFAVGRDKSHTAVVVTAGLLASLNRDELQGVIAHETSHIMNRDVLLLTFAGIMVGSIIMLSDLFLRGMRYQNGSSARYRSGGGKSSGGKGQGAVILVALVFAILSPILARALYFALSRKREYLADACAVRLTRYPEGLASALEKIVNNRFSPGGEAAFYATKVTAPMFIVNPLQLNDEDMGFTGVFSTHPPTSERIRILRTIAGGANYVNYQKAFNLVKGREFAMMPGSAMKDAGDVPIRKPFAAREEAAGQSVKDKTRAVGDIIRAVNNFAFLTCACGLKLKVPPDFNKEKFACPRCGKELSIPSSDMAFMAAAAGVVAANLPAKQPPAVEAAKFAPETGEQKKQQIYTRKTKGWESFTCASCGRLIQISPLHATDHARCTRCGSYILFK